MGGKILAISGLCFLSIPHIFGQQESYLTHFNYNKVFYNPAYAGYDGRWCINMVHHRQWIGLKDFTGRFRTEDHLPISTEFPANIAPVTQGFGLSMPINRRAFGDRINVGGVYIGFIDDVVGYEKNTMLKGGFAVAIPITENSTLRLGIDANYQTKRFNTTMLRAMTNPDPLIPSGINPGDSKLLLGSGIFFNTKWNSFFSGVSVSSWNQPSFSYLNIGVTTTLIKAARHAYFVAGASFGDKDFETQPCVMIKSANSGGGWVKPQLDAQVNTIYRELISAGAGIRAQVAGVDAFSVLLGFYPGSLWPSLQPRDGSFRVGYAYDVTLQSLRLSSRNSHELQVNYCFAIPYKSLAIRHPRDLMFHDKAKSDKKKKHFRLPGR
jgi:type IX secretion system PorP/SprF family membrane protein